MPIENWSSYGKDFNGGTKAYNCTYIIVDDGKGFPPDVLNEMITEELNGIINIGQTNDGRMIRGFYKG